MVSSFMMFIKLLSAYIAAYKVFKGHLKYASLMLLPAFLTGVELNTQEEEPWILLLSGNATVLQYQKSLLGGLALTAICFLLFTLFTVTSMTKRKERRSKLCKLF